MTVPPEEEQRTQARVLYGEWPDEEKRWFSKALAEDLKQQVELLAADYKENVAMSLKHISDKLESISENLTRTARGDLARQMGLTPERTQGRDYDRTDDFGPSR